MTKIYAPYRLSRTSIQQRVYVLVQESMGEEKDRPIVGNSVDAAARGRIRVRASGDECPDDAVVRHPGYPREEETVAQWDEFRLCVQKEKNQESRRKERRMGTVEYGCRV